MKLSRKFKDGLTIYLGIAFIAVLFGLAIYYEKAMWDECRQTNSFWYCVRVLNK